MKKGRLAIFFTYAAIITALLLGTVGGSQIVTVMAQREGIPRQNRIVIDPGHGGVDGGATSCTGVLESTINLEISLRLNDLFHLLGYETVMVRTSDISVYTEGETIAQKKISDLRQRVKLCSETENALLLSIHQNQFPESQYSGAQVFYNGMPESMELAQKLQSSFHTALNPDSRRQEKKASGVYLMDNIECPGILVECGFLSNPQEEAKLRDPDYQKRICSVIACTVSSYLQEPKSNT